MNTAIFDIDGCISDDEWRLPMIRESGQNRWDEYHANAVRDEKMNAEILHRHKIAGDKILFITARPESMREETWSWIFRNFGKLGTYGLLMRPNGDKTPSPELKLRLLEDSGHQIEEFVAAYDDREDVIAAYNSIGIKNAQVLRKPRRVPEILREMANTYEERQRVYGKSYVQFGHVAAALWPDGLRAKTPEEFMRLGVVVQIISKLTRYIGADGHVDSAHDMAVYAAILEEITRDSADL